MPLFGKKKNNDLEARFRAILSGDPALYEQAVDHVLNGEPYPIDQGLSQLRGQPTPTWEIVQAFMTAGTFTGNWRETLKLVAELPPDARQRVGEATMWNQRGNWLGMTLDLVRRSNPVPFTLAEIEKIGEPIGITKDQLLATMLSTAKWGSVSVWFAKFSDIDEWVCANISEIRPYFAEPNADSARSWDLISKLDPRSIKLLHCELAAAATGSSKTLRSTTKPIIQKVAFTDVESDLKALATDGQPTVRAEAVKLLGQLASADRLDEILTWAQENCAGDRAESVRNAVKEMSSVAEQPEPTEIALPEIDLDVEFPARAVEAADRNAGTSRHAQFLKAFFDGSNDRSHWGVAPEYVDLIRQDPTLVEDMSASHWVKLVLSGGSNSYIADNVVKLLEASGGEPSPLEIQVGSQLAGESPSSSTNRVLNILAAPTFSDQWTTADIEPWALHNSAVLENLLTEGKSWHWDIAGVFKGINSITIRPQSLDKALLECAIAGPKLSQGKAREVLDTSSIDAVIPYLSAGKMAERAGAANWLREMKDPAAEPALRKALKKEKQDLAKTQMMAALEACGASIDEFTSPAALLGEATKALAKKNAIPSSLDWLPADAIPQVRWEDGSIVDPNVLLWFLASAVKAKSAEPSPLLRRHFENMDGDDIRHLGRTLFDMWVSHDTRGANREEIEAEAREEAKRFVKRGIQHPQHSYYQGKTEDQWFDEMVTRFENHPPSHSASDCKGVLAIVAASGDVSLAPKVLKYLKTHRGRRLSQGKAMLQMLSWMDEPAATQVLLSVSQRFRPKGLNKQATIHAEELADRNGWTLDDLADRTVPEAGFDADGRQVIDYGGRTFTAHLGDDLTISLTNDETGKTVKSLPAARAAEDEAEVKDVKKDFTAAKKELKATAALQPNRLHQAMCIQRTWSAEDFKRYLVGHPVMCRLASRLVWWSAVGDGPKILFRPLTDTTLITVDDEEFALDPDSAVGLAHDLLVNEGDGDAWHGHMGDYEVAPLFAQFNRPDVKADDKNLIDDFRGFMMPEGAFRAQMNNYAWELGPPQDGGWVGEIVQDFPGVSLKAVFEHTGVSAGYYDHGAMNVAFGVLYFTSAHVYPSQQAAISLEKVPAILLSEMYAEAQAMASAGGFDPEWEKKSGL